MVRVIRIKADKTIKKWENILRLQQSSCTIPWSHDTGLDNQHSRHAITWLHREKQKWTKAPQDESPKESESRRTKPPKMRKYFKTPTIKVYDPMITWYRCGHQHSRHAITWKHRVKQKWTKAPQDESLKGSESRWTKPPKMRKYFKTPTINLHDPMITWSFFSFTNEDEHDFMHGESLGDFLILFEP